MRWLASRPRWLLLGAFVVLIVCVVLGVVLRNVVLSSATVLVFFVYFATLMAFVRRRENLGPRAHTDGLAHSRTDALPH